MSFGSHDGDDLKGIGSRISALKISHQIIHLLKILILILPAFQKNV